MMTTLRTPDGIDANILANPSPGPAPTLFVAALDKEASVEDDKYNRCGKLLLDQGWLSVAIDVPGHGKDTRPDEQRNSILNWRARLEKGERLVEEYVQKVSAVLDYLVREGYSNPEKIAFAGTSRGGFLALHAAAMDARIRTAACFAPLTDFSTLEEFKGLENHAPTQSLSVDLLTEKLTGKNIWFCVTNHDERVNTDRAYSVVRNIARASLAQGRSSTAEIHIVPRDIANAKGHRTPEGTHEAAAAWLARTLIAN